MPERGTRSTADPAELVQVRSTEGASSFLTFLAAWIYGAMALVSLGVLWWRGRLGELGPDPDSVAARYQLAGTGATDIALGMLVGWAIVVLLDTALRDARWAEFLEHQLRSVLDGLTASQAGFLALASGVGEELLFRGVVHVLLCHWLGLPLGLVLGAALFALAHVGPDRRFLGWTIFAWIMGMVLAGLYELTGSLLAPIAVHTTVNGLNLLQMVWERRLDPRRHLEENAGRG
jgi:membrane protease YdiL (CAAX protease family)